MIMAVVGNITHHMETAMADNKTNSMPAGTAVSVTCADGESMLYCSLSSAWMLVFITDVRMTKTARTCFAVTQRNYSEPSASAIHSWSMFVLCGTCASYRSQSRFSSCR